MDLAGSAEITLHPDVADTTSGPAYASVLLAFGTTVVHGGYSYDDQFSEFGGVTLQAFDISTGTPVRTDRQSREMNSLDGQYPGFDRLMAVKLDDSRGLVTWVGANARYMLIFQVSGGSITFGEPYIFVQSSDEVTPANTPLSADGIVFIDTDQHVAMTTRANGNVAWLGKCQDYHDPGNGSTWTERLVGADITTVGLVVTGVTWWVLEPGYLRFEFQNDGSSGARSVGNRTFYTYGLRAAWTTNEVTAYLGVVDWDAATPQMVSKVIGNVGLGSALEIVGDKLVLAESTDWLFQPTADLATPFDRVPANGAGAPYGSWFFRLDQTSTTDEWLASWWDEAQVPFVGRLSYADGVVTVIESFPMDTTPPQELSQHGAMTAIYAGDLVVIDNDFELWTAPYPYREYLLVYGTVVPPPITYAAYAGDGNLRQAFAPAR